MRFVLSMTPDKLSEAARGARYARCAVRSVDVSHRSKTVRLSEDGALVGHGGRTETVFREHSDVRTGDELRRSNLSVLPDEKLSVTLSVCIETRRKRHHRWMRDGWDAPQGRPPDRTETFRVCLCWDGEGTA